MSLLIYLDTETTNKYPETAGATQISAVIVRDGVEISSIDLDINPFSYNREITVSPKAFEITNKTIAEVKKYPSASVSYIKFIMWLNLHRNKGEYYTLVAYRTSFDIAVLESLFEDQVGNSRVLYDYIHFKTLDVLQLVLFMDLYGNIKTKNHKLETLCNYFKIPIKAHDALEDIRATRKLHKKLMEALGLPAFRIRKV